MKRILLSWMCAGLLLAAGCNDDDKDKKEDHDDLGTSDVPAAVSSAFTQKYPGATAVEWKKTKEDDQPTYTASFDSAGQKMKVEFDTTGAFIKEK